MIVINTLLWLLGCKGRPPAFIKLKEVYKKVYGTDYEQYIAVLEIPAWAARRRPLFEGTGKCRASRAKVLRFETKYGGEVLDIKEAYSLHDRSFIYRVGETVKPRKMFNYWPFVICASGIHFFMKRDDAKYY